MGKKVFMILLTLLMVFSTSIGVNATELGSDGASANVPVKYTVDNTEFIIRIPAELSPDTEDVEFSITADRMNLRPDESVVVSVAKGCNDNGQVILTRQGDNSNKPATLTTTLMINGTNISGNSNIVAMFRDSDNSTENLLGNVKMSALIVDENTRPGDYIGTVEFKVELRRD